MFWKRNAAITAVSGGVISVVALLAGAPSAKADELADLRANQELLQQRLDQLSQAGLGTGPAAPMGVGSFPRSFLIPGTDTSLRVGGQAVGSVLWYLKGSAPLGSLNGTAGQNNSTDGQGGTGNLASIPLKTPTSPAVAAATGAPNVTTSAGVAYSRSSQWSFSARQSQIYLDARQPSAYGEIKAFVSMDFAATNNGAILGNQGGVTTGYIPRIREGYATLGGLLIGQTTSTFSDNDSTPEILDFGGETGGQGIARLPQVRYTYPLGNGWVVAIAAENPDVAAGGPFGTYDFDGEMIPTGAACAVPVSVTTGGVAGVIVNNVTNECLGNAAFFNALQTIMPTFVLRTRVDQPWGHLQWAVVTEGYGQNDGRFLNKSYLGYGGSVSGHFFTWGKDNIGGGIAGGNGVGDQLGNGAGLATNFGGALNGQAVNATNSTSNFNVSTASRALYDSAVLSQTVVGFSAHIYYQHWWTDQLRSSVDFSMTHNDWPALVQASGRAALNKELDLTHLNLLWSPVAFVDLGIEGAWGHRQVVTNLRGDAYTIQTAMKVRF
jgi:hypothetical protein